MARQLRQITDPLKAWLIADTRLRLRVGEDHALPPLLEVSRLRGEALLRLRVLAFLEQQGVQPEPQLRLYQQLVTEGGKLLDLAQRIGLLAQFNRPPAADPKQAAVIAWSILVDQLHQAGETVLLETATDAVARHFLLGLYPAESKPARLGDLQLRQSVLRALRPAWGMDVQLRESFKTTPAAAEVSLRVKRPGYAWHVLHTETGEHLKPTRRLAYENLLARIQAGEVTPETEVIAVLPPVRSRNKPSGA